MSHRFRASLLLCLLSLPGLAGGCDKKERSHCPRYEQVRRVPATPKDAVVAEVNGRPILASEVRHRAREQGIDARAALQRLIDDELMVQEAERRGIHREPEVIQAGKQAAIWAYLRQGFEKDFTRKDVPEAALQRVYRANSHVRFHRPEIRRFAHLQVNRILKRRGRHLTPVQPQDDELKTKMQALRAAVMAAHPRDWQEFMALAELPEAKAIGASANAGTASRVQLMKPFADALWALKKPGEITGVITTRNWHHIAYLVQIIPGTNISYEQARPELLDVVWPLARRKALADTVMKIRKQCRIRMHPEYLPVSPAKTPEQDVDGASARPHARRP